MPSILHGWRSFASFAFYHFLFPILFFSRVRRAPTHVRSNTHMRRVEDQCNYSTGMYLNIVVVECQTHGHTHASHILSILETINLLEFCWQTRCTQTISRCETEGIEITIPITFWFHSPFLFDESLFFSFSQILFSLHFAFFWFFCLCVRVWLSVNSFHQLVIVEFSSFSHSFAAISLRLWRT